MGVYCEVCESTQLIRRKDGFFYCENCGVKYSLEAVKRLAMKDAPAYISKQSAFDIRGVLLWVTMAKTRRFPFRRT